MDEALSLLGEHLLTTSIPLALGVIILLLTLRRHLTRKK